MLKDIPRVKKTDNLYIAAVKQWNETFQGQDWNVFLINDNSFPLENLIILSHGSNKKDKTSAMRHKMEVLPAQSFAKIELLQPELFKLNNRFEVSFFNDDELGKMIWDFPVNSICDKNLRKIPLVPEKGILAETEGISI